MTPERRELAISRGLANSEGDKVGWRTNRSRRIPGSYVGFRTMSLLSEGPSSRGPESAPPLRTASGLSSRPGSRPASNAVRASQARAALRRGARRDEQDVAPSLRGARREAGSAPRRAGGRALAAGARHAAALAGSDAFPPPPVRAGQTVRASPP